MPTVPSIRTSVENNSTLVLDEHAKNGVFRRDARGRLIAYAGGFSVVFPYETSSGEKWVFRCWHSEVSNSRKRYEIISEAIKNSNLDFLCGFEYVDEGIIVDGVIYPTIRMRWIDGVTMKDYICQNRDSKVILQELADNFLRMTRALHLLSFAHGDLQHGNILVDKNHQIYLVDYDSFYCPQLRGEPDNVTGLPDYQHPARKTNKTVSEKLDYFSELVIYMSILAIAEAPYLVAKYRVEDADRLLFSKDDFEDLTNSLVYKDLQSLGNKFQDLLDILEEYLKCKSIDELSPFETFLLNKNVQFTSSLAKAIRNKQTITIAWFIPFDGKVTILEKIKGLVWDVKTKGSMPLTLSDDAVFELKIETDDGKIFTKELAIRVFDECEIEFSADKYYIFPTIPVMLSWNVKNAKRVWLDSEEVEASGKKVIEPEKATTCVLSAEDEFGIKERRIDIQMLPVPQVKSILVPTPNIVSNLAVTIKQPRYNVDVKIPEIDIDWIRAEMPKVKSLTELGLNVEFSPPLCRINLISSIKQMFNHIIENRYGRE